MKLVNEAYELLKKKSGKKSLDGTELKKIKSHCLEEYTRWCNDEKKEANREEDESWHNDEKERVNKKEKDQKYESFNKKKQLLRKRIYCSALAVTGACIITKLYWDYVYIPAKESEILKQKLQKLDDVYHQLLDALQKNDEESIDMLLEKHKDFPIAREIDRKESFIMAVDKAGNYQLFLKLMKRLQDQQPIVEENKYVYRVCEELYKESFIKAREKKKTLLVVALEKNNYEMLAFLLKNRVEIDSKDLFQVSSIGVIRLLKQHGADIEVRNNDNKTLLFEAIKQGNIPLIHVIGVNKSAAPELVKDAGRRYFYKELLDAHSSDYKNVLDEYKDEKITDLKNYFPTLFECAVYHNDLNAVEGLVKKGWSLPTDAMYKNFKSSYRIPDLIMIKFLEQQGIKIAYNAILFTILSMANIYSTDTIRHCVSKLKKTPRDNDGNTPWHYIAHKCLRIESGDMHGCLPEIMANAGYEVDQVNKDKKSPLMILEDICTKTDNKACKELKKQMEILKK